MKKVAVLILSLALFAGATFAAPVSNLEAEIEEALSADTDSSSLKLEDVFSDEEMAMIEQSTLRGLFGHILNGANNYAQTKLSEGRRRNGGRGAFKTFLGDVLNSGNNYAQNRLSRPRNEVEMQGEERAQVEASTVRELGKELRDSVASYVISKLISSGSSSSNPSLEDVFSDEEMAMIERSNLRGLFGEIFNSANNYAQQRLSRGGKNSDLKNLVGDVLNSGNEYLQDRLSQPQMQQGRYLPRTPSDAPLSLEDVFSDEEMAMIEQSDLKGLFGEIFNSANNYAQQKLSRGGKNSDLNNLLGDVLNRANDYAQDKLSQPQMQGYDAQAERSTTLRIETPTLSVPTTNNYLSYFTRPYPGTRKAHVMTEEEKASEQALSALLAPLVTTGINFLLNQLSQGGNSGGGGGGGGNGGASNGGNGGGIFNPSPSNPSPSNPSPSNPFGGASAPSWLRFSGK